MGSLKELEKIYGVNGPTTKAYPHQIERVLNGLPPCLEDNLDTPEKGTEFKKKKKKQEDKK